VESHDDSPPQVAKYNSTPIIIIIITIISGLQLTNFQVYTPSKVNVVSYWKKCRGGFQSECGIGSVEAEMNQSQSCFNLDLYFIWNYLIPGKVFNKSNQSPMKSSSFVILSERIDLSTWKPEAVTSAILKNVRAGGCQSQNH